MLSEHSIAQSPRAQYGTIRVKAVRILPKMYKFSARRADAAQALMVRSSRITSTAGYSFPSLRRSVSAPVLPRASHTHGLDSDSGFWIRIRIGLDYGRICHPSAIICHHLLSSAVRRPPVQNSSCESACKRCKRCKSQLKAVSHPDRQDRTEKNTAHPGKSGELCSLLFCFSFTSGSGRGIRWSRASAGCRRFLPGSPARR